METRPDDLRRSAWRAVVGFGVVSLSADLVYEGARSVTGPMLASVGASALLVGLVTGGGEALALGLRVLSGPWADRTGRHWTLTTVGYAMTAVAIPLLVLVPLVGAAGLALASALVLTERVGKAVRSPSKSTLLARVAAPVGRGRGIGVHKALDQLGAFAGPLLVAGVLALSGSYWPAMGVLAVPGVVSLVLLRRVRVAAAWSEEPPPDPAATARLRRTLGMRGLGRGFWLLSMANAACSLGLVTFAILAFHLVEDGVLAAALVPVAYAGAMAVEAVVAPLTGIAFDRVGAVVLVVVPLTAAAVPWLGFSDSVLLALAGVLLWGVAAGVQDSTVKALVAELAPPDALGAAYGAFALVQGVAVLIGGVVVGALYAVDRTAVGVWVGAAQVVALAVVVVVARLVRRA